MPSRRQPLTLTTSPSRSRRSHAATAIASLVTERQFMAQVCQLAEVLGWSWAHFRPAMTSKGWRTPVSGPLGAGFPDLLLCRGDRIIAAELKSQDGRLSPAQREVLDIIGRAVPVHVWRPADLDAVAGLLR